MDPHTIAEARELLSHLVAQGFGRLLSALEDPAVRTANGRVIAAAVGRRLGMSALAASAELRRAKLALNELIS